MEKRSALAGRFLLAKTAPGDYAMSIQEAVENGARPDQAIKYATADVAMEVIAERVPMDELLGSAAGNPKRAAGIMDAVLKQYGIRMTGEELNWLGRVAAEASGMQNHPAFAKVIALEMLKEQNYEQAYTAASRVVWQQALDWAMTSKAFEATFSLDENAIDGREALDNNALENPGETEMLLDGVQDIPEAYGQQEAIDQTAQLGSDSLGEVGDGAVPEESQVHSQELEQEFMEFKEVLGEDAPETLEDFKNLKYNDPERWDSLKTMKEQTIFVENAPCVTTPLKYTGYFLKPGTAHAEEFFDVGYAQDNPLQLRYDMAEQFDMEKAVEKTVNKKGEEKFSIFMDLGITKKKRFRTVWQIDPNSDEPRIITAHRENEKNDI